MSSEGSRIITGEVIAIDDEKGVFTLDLGDSRTANLWQANFDGGDGNLLETGARVDWHSGWSEVDGVKTYVSRCRISQEG